MTKEMWIELAKKNSQKGNTPETCWCSGCGEVFSGEYSFDKHRVDFKCRTSRGMMKAGMGKNGRGVWVSERKELEYVSFAISKCEAC